MKNLLIIDHLCTAWYTNKVSYVSELIYLVWQITFIARLWHHQISRRLNSVSAAPTCEDPQAKSKGLILVLFQFSISHDSRVKRNGIVSAVPLKRFFHFSLSHLVGKLILSNFYSCTFARKWVFRKDCWARTENMFGFFCI